MPSASQHKNGGRCFIIDKTHVQKKLLSYKELEDTEDVIKLIQRNL